MIHFFAGLSLGLLFALVFFALWRIEARRYRQLRDIVRGLTEALAGLQREVRK